MKSEKYIGVYQRKNGTWYYRIKKILEYGGKPTYLQRSGFGSEEDAHGARESALQIEVFGSDGWHGETAAYGAWVSFDTYFQRFLNDCESQATVKKYSSLYSAQLSTWANRNIFSFSNTDIDLLLLRLTLEGYKDSYISSIRKMVKAFFRYAHHIDKRVSGETAQLISTKPYRLRVLSLFSGIGAPEQALKELGINYEIVNYCEIDKKASHAYSLLHGISEDKNLGDVNCITQNYGRSTFPNFDLMFFGFPCQDNSLQGNQLGLIAEGTEHPLLSSLRYNEINMKLTRSGLFYRALQVVLLKKPKFLIAENVTGLISKKLKNDFEVMLKRLQEAGYNVYFETLNSKDFGVPQNRPRVYMIMIRDDLNMKFKFPEPQPLSIRAEDWFEAEVSDEYYLKQCDIERLNRNSFRPNFNREYISCITTNWGSTNSSTQQTYIKDKKGVRCLTSEELMRFQGFPPEYGTILRENGFKKAAVGKLVGNSMTVPVLKAIICEFINAFSNKIAIEIIPKQVVIAKEVKEYVDPLFAYSGNKSKLMANLNYILPAYLQHMTFFDLFAGSATVATNVVADRVVINDREPLLIDIYQALSSTPPQEAWDKVMGVINEYGLSPTNEEGYLKCRADYNKIPYEERGKFWFWGLALVYHSFNTSTVQFNKKGNFNSPFGGFKCNVENSKRRFFPFAQKLYEGNYEFTCKSYKEFLEFSKPFDEYYFYYVDPPYYVSTASYNKDWKEQDERDLYRFLDKCTAKGVEWLLSNALENNGQRNEILAKWLLDHDGFYKVYYLNRDYGQSSYNRKNKGDTIEIAVWNG